jgi:hypothetical protein
MAVEFPGQIISLKSSGNLSAKQFHFVAQSTAADLVVLLSTANNAELVGVLQNAPSTAGGDAASVMVSGVTKVAQNSTGVGAIARGNALICSGSGGVKKSTGGVSDFIIGRALSAQAANTTGLVAMRFTWEGFGSSQ